MSIEDRYHNYTRALASLDAMREQLAFAAELATSDIHQTGTVQLAHDLETTLVTDINTDHANFREVMARINAAHQERTKDEKTPREYACHSR